MLLKQSRICTFALILSLAGCATNPVTGKKELSLISEQQELAIGAEQYSPSRQAQGGDYVADPDLTAYISKVGNRLAEKSDRKLPYEFKVLNNSTPNAWALPGGKIAINRGLLTQLRSESELAAVLGHEIVHAAARHGAQQMSKGILLQTAVVGTAMATQGENYADMAQLGTGLGAQLLSQKFGRDAERESDYYGMIYMSRLGYDPQGAVDLQRTFVKLSEGGNQAWLSGLLASHPASQERVQNNLTLLKTLPKGGDMGVARYQKKIAHLLKTKPAYDAYDKGRAALAKGDASTAQSLALKAVALEPREALFHGLAGDVAQKNKQYQAARSQYDKAINLNPNFFYFYLQRGQANQHLNLNHQAKADLEKSLQLLPTANANFALGHLAQQAGDLKTAKTFYAKVASSENELGLNAYGLLVELDIKDNPNSYLKLRVGKGSMGHIMAEIGNPTPQKIGDIHLVLTFQNEVGQTRTLQRSLSGTIAPGKKKLFDLNLKGVLPEQQLQTLQVNVSQARIIQ